MWFAATTGLYAGGGGTCRGSAGPAESRLRTRPMNESVSRCCFMNVILQRTTTLLRSLPIALRHFIESVFLRALRPVGGLETVAAVGSNACARSGSCDGGRDQRARRLAQAA